MRPLGNKDSKRNERARECLEGVGVATSVKQLSEKLRNSDNKFAQRAEVKHRLAKQSHMLKIYQTLFLPEQP
jgi:hypothetical protein